MAYDGGSDGGQKAEDILRLQAEFETERANWDSLWRCIAEVCFPRGDVFQRTTISQGETRGEKVFDTTPILALDRYAAARDSLITPDTEQWHSIETTDDALNKREDIKEYFEAATDKLFGLRYGPMTGFATGIHEYHISDGAFGSGVIYVDEAIGRHFRYRCLHMGEIYFGENHQGIIDRLHRKFTLKAYQVQQKVDQEGWIMPARVQVALDGKKQMAEFEFIHAVYPNEGIDPRRLDWRGMQYKSCYVSCEDKQLVSEGGFRTFPYAVGRHATGPKETYGRSPAMAVLRDVLMLNEMSKSVIRAAQFHIEPPFLVSDESALQPFKLTPNALNYGYVDESGQPLVVPLRPEGDLPMSLELIQDRRTAINDAFWITLFQILVDKPQITATEALLRAQEKGQLLGPTMGREQSEFLSTMIERELDIANMAGQLPPMPEALVREIAESGGEIKITYKAPINRLQRAGKALGILRTVDALTAAAEIDPDALLVFSGKWGEIGREIGEINDVPPTLMNSDEEIAAIKAQKDQQQQVGSLVEAAPQLGRTIKDLAQAHATVNNDPPPIPYVQPAS